MVYLDDAEFQKMVAERHTQSSKLKTESQGPKF
jgi:hypothetical protein